MLLLMFLKNVCYMIYGGIYIVFKFLLMVIFFYYLKFNGKVFIYDGVLYKFKVVEIRIEIGVGFFKCVCIIVVRVDWL